MVQATVLLARAMSPTPRPRSLLSSSTLRWTAGSLLFLLAWDASGLDLVLAHWFGTGTLSGPRPEQGGSLMELSAGGKQPLRLSNGETRSYLEDGDTVILRGYCLREGFRRIGFGECRGTVLPALVPGYTGVPSIG